MSTRDGSAPTLALSAPKPIDCWGDSMTAGYVPFLAGLTDLTVFNGGIGGQTSTQIRDRMLAATASRDHHTVLWAGRNNLVAHDIVLADIAAMVSVLGHTRYLVLGVTNGDYGAWERAGNPGYDGIIALNQKLAAAYGSHFVDIRTWLVAEGLATVGVSPSAQDLRDIADDLVPESLRSDPLHLNDKGNAAVAQKVFVELGRVIAADPGTEGNPPPPTAVLPQNPIETWRLSHFDSILNRGTGADTSDPDKDGLANLLEYATGFDPQNASGPPPFSLGQNGPFLTFTYTRIADPALIYTVQGASGPDGPWDTIAAPNNPLTASNTAGPVTVTDTVSLRETARRFLRLKIHRFWPTDPLAAWRLVYFSATADSGQGAAAADPDRDGLANLLEYATGTAPNQAGASTVKAGHAGAFLTLTYQHIPDPALIYTVEGADNPGGPWQTVAATDNPLTLSDTVGPVTVTDTFSLEENPRRFLRLRVSRVWAADPFEAWRLTYFAANPDAPEASVVGDPDQDGLPNLLEYAIGTAPHRPGASPIVLERSGSFLAFTYPRIGDPVLIYTVEGAADPAGPWTTIETDNNPLTGSASPDPVTVTDTVPLETTAFRFLRLRVSR